MPKKRKSLTSKEVRPNRLVELAHMIDQSLTENPGDVKLGEYMAEYKMECYKRYRRNLRVK